MNRIKWQQKTQKKILNTNGDSSLITIAVNYTSFVVFFPHRVLIRFNTFIFSSSFI